MSSSEAGRIGVKIPLVGAEVIASKHDGIQTAEYEVVKRFRSVEDERFKGGFVWALMKFIQDIDSLSLFYTQTFIEKNGGEFLKIPSCDPREWIQGYVEATAYLLFIVNKDYNKDLGQLKKIVYGTLQALILTKSK